MSQLVTGQSLIVFGLAVVTFVFLLRRTFLRKHGPATTEREARGRDEIESAEMSAEAVVEKLEVRLYDFAREVENRMQTRIAVLDRLIVDADREILRLQDVLADTKGIGGTGTRAATSTRQPDVTVPSPAPGGGTHRDAA